MSDIPLRIIKRPTPGDSTRLHRVGRVPGGGYALDPGDMWHEPDLDGERGECWAIMLPNGRVWRTTISGSDGYWDVTGEPPMITVQPSINDTDPKHGWHGWIRDGKLTQA